MTNDELAAMLETAVPQKLPNLCQLFNNTRKGRGDTLQNGVRPGAKKLEQFKEAMRLAEVPPLYSQENERDPLARVKLFDPCGSWTWYVTEFSEVAPDGCPNLAHGLVHGFEDEIGYIGLEELASTRGATGIGIELDMHWTPRKLSECRED